MELKLQLFNGCVWHPQRSGTACNKHIVLRFRQCQPLNKIAINNFVTNVLMKLAVNNFRVYHAVNSCSWRDPCIVPCDCHQRASTSSDERSYWTADCFTVPIVIWENEVTCAWSHWQKMTRGVSQRNRRWFVPLRSRCNPAANCVIIMNDSKDSHGAQFVLLVTPFSTGPTRYRRGVICNAA